MTDTKNVILLIIFYIFCTGTAIQLFYYLFFYLAVSLNNKRKRSGSKPPVSIIICARNEAENLTAFLPAVLEQDYPDYEVIVVNDCSEDNTYDVLAGFLKKYPHLRISNVTKDPKFTHSKKFAQFIGIKAAKNEILLFTDADCRPESNKWIEEMSAHFDEGVSFVLGYGGYFRQKGFLNKYIRYDSFVIAMQYLGMALRGVPYMAVGRNLAYRRSVFFDNKGFGSHINLASGDDDLFVNSNGTGKNTEVEYSLPSHTRSVPSLSFSSWLMQKRRHLTTAPYYKFRDKFLLVTEPFTRILFYISFVILLSFLFMWPWVLGVFALRLVCQIIVVSLTQKKLNEQGLLPFILFFDIFSPLFNGIIFLSNNRKLAGNNKWK
jgi:cellulose synthase/poly-beta-1,6-N-acetylglucosamine synthase-like glycosyltransferase